MILNIWKHGFIQSYGCTGIFSLCSISIDKEGLSEAFNAIDNAIRIDKNYARAYATKAELYFYEREFDSMMINAKKAFELAPGE